MVDWLIVLWLIVFMLLFAANIGADSAVFGLLAGLWLLVLGLGIIVSGIQVQSGYTIEVVGGSSTIEYSYSNVSLPFSTASMIWGVFLILISVFMIYSNGEDLL